MSDPFGPRDPQQRPQQPPQQQPPQPQQPQQRPPQPQGYPQQGQPQQRPPQQGQPPQGQPPQQGYPQQGQPRPPQQQQQQPPRPQPQPQPPRSQIDDLSEPFLYAPEDDDMRRRRQLVIAAAVVLAVLLGGFFVLNRGDGKSSTEQGADLVASGLTAYTQGDYAAARKNFQDALAQDPANPFAHYNLGLIMQVVDNNPAGAEAEYRKAIALKPEFASPLFNLGIIRANAGAKDEAIDLYRRAIAADDQFASPHLNLGFLLLEKDPCSLEAQEEFSKAVILDPTMQSRIPKETTCTTSTTTKKSGATTTTRKR